MGSPEWYKKITLTEYDEEGENYTFKIWRLYIGPMILPLSIEEGDSSKKLHSEVIIHSAYKKEGFIYLSRSPVEYGNFSPFHAYDIFHDLDQAVEEAYKRVKKDFYRIYNGLVSVVNDESKDRILKDC